MTLLTVRHPLSPKAKPRRQPKLPWIKALKWTDGQGPASSSLTRLLVLDSQGRLITLFLGTLPDPLVLQHHLTRLTKM